MNNIVEDRPEIRSYIDQLRFSQRRLKRKDELMYPAESSFITAESREHDRQGRIAAEKEEVENLIRDYELHPERYMIF